MEEAAPQEREAAPESGAFDCKQIWDDVFRDGEAEKGSFFLIRRGGELVSIEENEFTVVVANSITQQHAENNRELLENLMEKHTGKRRRMKLSMADSESEQLSPEKIAKNAGDLLGINVEIE